MQWSQFVHFFPNVKILWHALKFEKYIIDEPDIFRHFLPGCQVSPDDFGDVLFEELFDKGFIVEENSDEACLHDYAWVTAERRNIQALYLILSTKCNLKCAYCLYKADNSGSLTNIGQHMNKEVAREAIDVFVQETSKNDRSQPGYWEEITLYGGEPLLNQTCLETSVSYIRQLQLAGKAWPGINLVLNTNGTLFDANFIQFARREQIEVQVSIDGPAIIHDQVRQFRNGQGSFDKVMRGLEMMRSADLNFVPLLTITDVNIDSLADFVGWLCQKFSIKHYGLNLLMHTGGVIDSGYGVRAAKAMLATHTMAASYGAIDKMYEGIFQVFAKKQVTPQSCGAGRKLVIFPDGGIHACQALEASGVTKIGALPLFSPNEPNMILWARRNRFNNPECLTCPAIGGCGGGCGASAYNAFSDLHGVDPNQCTFMKHVFTRWLGE